jgi:hypothetical protein
MKISKKIFLKSDHPLSTLLSMGWSLLRKIRDTSEELINKLEGDYKKNNNNSGWGWEERLCQGRRYDGGANVGLYHWGKCEY